MPVDLFTANLVEDPYPTYASLREREPYFDEAARMWVISRYADVQPILRSPRFTQAGFAERVARSLGNGPLTECLRRWLLFRDPPHHTRLRALVTQAFTPRAVDCLRHSVQLTVDALLARVEPLGRMDVIADLAYPLPVQVICTLLGVPAEDREGFAAWSAALAESLDALTTHEPDVVRRGDVATSGFTAYFRDLVRARRLAPGDDLLSALIGARDGEDRLSEDELLATCILLFFAGHETTVNLIGNGMLALLRHPRELRRLLECPALIANAVEELLRFDAPLQRTARTVEDDTCIGGTRVPCGQRILLLLGAANRDPRRFEDPDQLDVSRTDASQHVSFGGGIHYCVGAPLARLEAHVAIGSMLRRLPGLQLDDATPTWRNTVLLRGLRSLSVTFTTHGEVQS